MSRSPVGVSPAELRVSATRWPKRCPLPAFKFKQFYLADAKNDRIGLLTMVLFQLQSCESTTLLPRWMRWVLRLAAQTIPLPPVQPSSILFFKTFNFHAHQSKRYNKFLVPKPSEKKQEWHLLKRRSTKNASNVSPSFDLNFLLNIFKWHPAVKTTNYLIPGNT